MSLKAQNKPMAVPSRDLYLVFRRSSDMIIKDIRWPNSQAQSRNTDQIPRKCAKILSQFLISHTLKYLVGFKFGFSYLSLSEKRNNSVMKINRSQNTEAVPPFGWLYIISTSAVKDIKRGRSQIHKKFILTKHDFLILATNFRGYFINDIAYKTTLNMFTQQRQIP